MADEIQVKHADLKRRKEELEVRLMEEQLAASDQKRTEREQQRKQIEQSLINSNAQERQRQTVCAHRKGGRGELGLSNGNDNNYSVNKHTREDGQTTVMCTRCNKQWYPGDPDYAEAMRYPTDNTPSGSVTFTGIKIANPGAAVA